MIYNSKPPKNYFSHEELSCRHCKESKIDMDFVAKLNWARHIAGVPFTVTSAYRCPEHNKSLGAAETSSHVKGIGIDLFPKDNHHRFRMVVGLLTVGFKRIRIYSEKGHIHVDADADKGMEILVIDRSKPIEG